MSDSKPGRGSDQFPLRFPDGMRDRLKSEAAANGRSLNAEIINRLESTLNISETEDTSIPQIEVLSSLKVYTEIEKIREEQETIRKLIKELKDEKTN